jgi:hypothetical protein
VAALRAFLLERRDALLLGSDAVGANDGAATDARIRAV